MFLWAYYRYLMAQKVCNVKACIHLNKTRKGCRTCLSTFLKTLTQFSLFDENKSIFHSECSKKGTLLSYYPLRDGVR